MDNLEIYERGREVPKGAQKTIGAGRIKNFTDINPMWRIKKLTELFGACGLGWWYTIDRQWLEPAPNGEVKAFCNITLYYADPETGEKSAGIIGTGGSSFIANEKAGIYVSDECYKMALTDAISVAAKALGIGADIYWNKDNETKYESKNEQKTTTPKTEKPVEKDVDLDTERITKGINKITEVIDKLKEQGVDRSDVADCIKKHYSVNNKPSANYKKITDIKLLLTIYNELNALLNEDGDEN
jgi:hypothetical protein